MAYPKIELHVHLEGTVRPETLLAIARRNDVSLPARSVGEFRELYRYRDFPHFLEVWYLTTQALRTAEDFRQVVVEYAAEAAVCGAVYIEGSFSPAEPARRGVRWEEIFSGYCDGAQEARERFGVEIRLTPEIVSGFRDEEAALTVRHAIAYRERGVVGVGLVPHKGGVLVRALLRCVPPGARWGLGLRSACRRGGGSCLRSQALAWASVRECHPSATLVSPKR